MCTRILKWHRYFSLLIMNLFLHLFTLTICVLRSFPSRLSLGFLHNGKTLKKILLIFIPIPFHLSRLYRCNECLKKTKLRILSSTGWFHIHVLQTNTVVYLFICISFCICYSFNHWVLFFSIFETLISLEKKKVKKKNLSFVRSKLILIFLRETDFMFIENFKFNSGTGH